MSPTERDIEDAVAKAEIHIEAILRRLEQLAERRVDQVEVDTRNFANLNVEIFLREPRMSEHAQTYRKAIDEINKTKG